MPPPPGLDLYPAFRWWHCTPFFLPRRPVKTTWCFSPVLWTPEVDGESGQNKGYDLQWNKENLRLSFPIQGRGSGDHQYLYVFRGAVFRTPFKSSANPLASNQQRIRVSSPPRETVFPSPLPGYLIQNGPTKYFDPPHCSIWIRSLGTLLIWVRFGIGWKSSDSPSPAYYQVQADSATTHHPRRVWSPALPPRDSFQMGLLHTSDPRTSRLFKRPR